MINAGYRRRYLKYLVFHVFLFSAAGCLAWLSVRYPLQIDWTDDSRNTLATASQHLLDELNGPVRIVSYASKNAELRGKIRTAIDRFQRFKADLTLVFVNPDEAPDTVRNLGIRVDGEMIIHYRDRSESLRELSESAISNTLFRLSKSEEPWIVFLSGHGERSASGFANHDLGQFGKQLQNKGYRIFESKPTSSDRIPDNASLLVIADPSVDMLAGEIDSILEFIRKGGNLLWLQDSGQLHGLDRLEDLLGIRFEPGTVVDTGSRAYGINNPAFVTLSEYPDHPINDNMHSTSLFPKSRAIEAKPDEAFHSAPVFQSSAQSWSERGPIKGHLQFNPEQGEKAGPLIIGLSLTRQFDGREQKILLVGDSDFLSNTYLGNGINLDLGLNMIGWLTATDKSIEIPLHFQSDRVLKLSPAATARLGIVFLIGLPSALIISGFAVSRRRKRS